MPMPLSISFQSLVGQKGHPADKKNPATSKGKVPLWETMPETAAEK